MKSMKNDRVKKGMILSLMIIFAVLCVYLMVAPYHDNTRLMSLHYKTDIYMNCSSYAYEFGGDFENATISWNANTTGLDLYFAILSSNSTYMLTHAKNGTIHLYRNYFLAFPYSCEWGGTEWGGTGYRGVYLYFRSETGSSFQINITVNGFLWDHWIDIVQQKSLRCMISVASVFIVIILPIALWPRFEGDKDR